MKAGDIPAFTPELGGLISQDVLLISNKQSHLAKQHNKYCMNIIVALCSKTKLLIQPLVQKLSHLFSSATSVKKRINTLQNIISENSGD